MQVEFLSWHLGQPAGKVEGRMIRFLQSAENIRGLKIGLKANQRINVGMLAGVLMVVPRLQDIVSWKLRQDRGAGRRGECTVV
jgi:hypothetical protein